MDLQHVHTLAATAQGEQHSTFWTLRLTACTLHKQHAVPPVHSCLAVLCIMQLTGLGVEEAGQVVGGVGSSTAASVHGMA